MKQLHELRFIHPKITLSNLRKKELGRIAYCIRDHRSFCGGQIKNWLCYLVCLVSDLKKKDLEDVASRLVLSNADAGVLMWYNSNSSKILKKLGTHKKAVRPRGVYKLLRGAPAEALLVLMAKTDNPILTGRIRDYLEFYSRIKLRVGGRDIKKMGIEPSAEYGKIMTELLYLKLDKKLENKKQELSELSRLVDKHKRRKVKCQN